MTVLTSTINLAAIYALVALGIALTWAGLRFLNLAQAITFATAGYGAWWMAEHVSENGAVVLAAGIVTGALASVLVFLLVFLTLDGKPNWEIRTLTATLALNFVGVNVLQEVFGGRPKELPAVFGTDTFRLGDTVITADKSGAIISAIVLVAIILVALGRSRLGLGVRALTQNTEGAALVGINRKTAALAILATSGALAGLASVLLAQVYYVSPEAGNVPLVKGLIVALLGGLGSLPGTIIAALMVGATEAVTATYLGGQYVLMTLFLLIAIVLTVRPRGIAGILDASRA